MPISLDKILKAFNISKQEFRNMTDEEWKQKTDQKLKELESHPYILTLQAFAMNCEKAADRKKRLDADLEKEIVTKPTTLSMETPNTDQHKARKEEIEASKDPINAAVAQSGEVAFNYVIKGENKAEIQKSREGLLDAYDKHMSPKKLTDADKEKYKPEIVVFKTWAELKGSDKLFQDTKDNYKDMKFPLEMTILKFDSSDEGKAFMEKQGKPYLTKPVPKPAAEKKEDEKADVDKTKKQDDATQATVPTGPK